MRPRQIKNSRMLYSIVVLHKILLVILFAKFVFLSSLIANVLTEPTFTTKLTISLIAFVAVESIAVVPMFALCLSIYQMKTGFAGAFLGLIPLIGWIAFFIAIRDASNMMRQAGLKVGPLGASLAESKSLDQVRK